MKEKKNVIITAVVLVVVAIGAFFGGMHYQKSQASTSIQNGFQARSNNQAFQRRTTGGTTLAPVNGEIIDVDADSVTVKLPDGSSKIVILSDKTTINKTSESTKSDLKKGDKVTAFGTANADGSVTAQNVSIGGMMLRGNPGGTGQRLNQSEGTAQ